MVSSSWTTRTLSPVADLDATAGASRSRQTMCRNSAQRRGRSIATAELRLLRHVQCDVFLRKFLARSLDCDYSRCGSRGVVAFGTFVKIRQVASCELLARALNVGTRQEPC
jgi:hypothetical protein